MAGVSSLLKSAAATQKKVQAAQDALMAFNWENSAQTKDDFIEYSKYLQDKQDKTTDPTDILSYATKLRGAQRSFVSNEIQRQTMNVMEGGGTLTDKQNTIKDLYYQAFASGDYNLAQNLASQYDSLSVQIQNEAKVAFGNAVAAGQKATDKLLSSLLKGKDYVTLPNGQVVAPLNLISQQIKQSGGLESGVNVWQAAQNTIETFGNLVQAALDNAPDQETADKIINDYGGYFDGSKTFDILGQKLTASDVASAQQNDQFNNPLFSLQQKYNPSTGQNEFKLERNAAQDYQWVRTGVDPTTGEDLFAPTPVQVSKLPQDIGLGLDTQITNNGEIIGSSGAINAGTGTAQRNDSQNIRNRLLALGIQANPGKDGKISITLPDGNTYDAVITPQGTVRFVGNPNQYSGGQPGLFEISLTDQNNFGIDPQTGQPYSVKAGELRPVAPDETSIFGTNSLFGGKMSQASAAGERTLNAYSNPGLGQLAPVDLRNRGLGAISGPALNGPIRIGNDFTGMGSPVTSSLLQSANFTLQAKAQEEQQRAAAAAALLQPANVFNLNQSPVQQYAQNGAPIRQLSVARPTPQPAIRVAPPTPAPRVTVTNAPNPLGQLGISGNYTGTLRVVNQ